MDPSRFQTGGTDRPPDSQTPPTPGAALHEALEGVKEVTAYAAQYAAAKVDRWKLTARSLVIYAILGVVALLVGLVVVIVATSLLVMGLAQAIAAVLGGRMWAGNLIVGGGILLLLGAGTWLGLKMYNRSSRRKTVERYEQRLKHQRQSFGHDARQRTYADTGR
jgi:hypothetical protein